MLLHKIESNQINSNIKIIWGNSFFQTKIFWNFWKIFYFCWFLAIFVATKSVKIFGILAIRSRNQYLHSHISIMNHKYDSWIRNNLFQSPMPQLMTSLLKAVLVSHSMSNTKWELVEQRWVLRAICVGDDVINIWKSTKCRRNCRRMLKQIFRLQEQVTTQM